MCSQYSKNGHTAVCDFDEHFLNLLEVGGGAIRRCWYRKCVRTAKEFYSAYVTKCREYNTYIDFFTPLSWHLIACGCGYRRTMKYLSIIRDGIVEHLNKQFRNMDAAPNGETA